MEESPILIECPVCLQIPRVTKGKIYQCTYGHILCSSCKEQLYQCPTCRARPIDHRNLIAENYIREFLFDIPIQCRHKLCNVKLPMKNNTIDDHESECRERLITCPSFRHYLTSCDWKGKLHEFYNHLILREISNKTECCIVIRENKNHLLSKDTKLFQITEKKVNFSEVIILTQMLPTLILADNRHTNILIYLRIWKTCNNEWIFSISSNGPKKYLKNIYVRLQLEETSNIKNMGAAAEGIIIPGPLGKPKISISDHNLKMLQHNPSRLIKGPLFKLNIHVINLQPN